MATGSNGQHNSDIARQEFIRIPVNFIFTVGRRGSLVQVKEIKTGGVDQRGREVLDVYWSTENYVIYQHAKGISPHFSDKDDDKAKQIAGYHSIGPLLSMVNALRSGTARNAASIDREIARGIAQCLEGDIENAQKTLTIIQKRLQNLRTIEGRIQYLSGSLIAAALVLGILYVLVCRSSSPEEAERDLSLLHFALIGAFGSLGGFLSIAIGINKVIIDPDTNLMVNVISGALRIVIAVIGSIFVYLAIISKLVLGNLGLESLSAGMFAFAMAAGFSETFVPNILGRLISSHQDDPEKSELDDRE